MTGQSNRPDTHRHKRSTDISTPEYVSVVDDNAISGQIAPGDSITVSASVQIMIPRDICADINFICVQVLSADGATYTVDDGTVHIFCSDITTQKQCQGKIFNEEYYHFFNKCK